MSIDALAKEYLKYLDNSIKEYDVWVKKAIVDGPQEDIHIYGVISNDVKAMRDKFKELMKKYKEVI